MDKTDSSNTNIQGKKTIQVKKEIKNQKTVVMSLGGSIIVPDDININFLKQFKNLLLEDIKKNDTRFILICGGGSTARKYINAAKELGIENHDELDWIGIHSTYINASLVKSMFKEYSYEYVINNPTVEFKPDKNIIIASGWKPGFSTDMDAVLLAKQFKAKQVLNVSNIDYVYSEDPKINPDAEKFDVISWKKYLDIIGTEWKPGKSAPFDPIASKEAMDNNIKVLMMKATIEQIKKFLETNKTDGTIIG